MLQHVVPFFSLFSQRRTVHHLRTVSPMLTRQTSPDTFFVAPQEFASCALVIRDDEPQDPLSSDLVLQTRRTTMTRQQVKLKLQRRPAVLLLPL